MKNAVTIVLAAAVGASMSMNPLHAQQPAPSPNSVAVYFQIYSGLDTVDDPDTGTWDFGDNAFGLGAMLQRQLGPSLMLGADVSYARPAYERRQDGEDMFTGDAQLLTTMVTGRLAYGGAASLGFFLSGGAGVIAYNLEDVGGWNADFALRGGTGVEYQFQPGRALFLEWGRLWGYHETVGVSGGKATHSILRLGTRFNF